MSLCFYKETERHFYIGTDVQTEVGGEEISADRGLEVRLFPEHVWAVSRTRTATFDELKE
jgi:hypothetical protein